MKRNKLFVVIVALCVTFAFIPSMAFADTGEGGNTTKHKLTVMSDGNPVSDGGVKINNESKAIADVAPGEVVTIEFTGDKTFEYVDSPNVSDFAHYFGNHYVLGDEYYVSHISYDEQYAGITLAEMSKSLTFRMPDRDLTLNAHFNREGSKASEVFPDLGLRKALVKQGYLENVDDIVTHFKLEKFRQQTSLSVGDYIKASEVHNFKGLELFSNVTSFFCYGDLSPVKNVNETLKSMKKLYRVELYTTNIEGDELDLSGLTELSSVIYNASYYDQDKQDYVVDKGTLKSFKANPDKISYLKFIGADLKTFDATPYKELFQLYLAFDNLTDVNISENKGLNMISLRGNDLQDVKLPESDEILYFEVSDTPMEYLDLRAPKMIAINHASGNDAMPNIGVYYGYNHYIIEYPNPINNQFGTDEYVKFNQAQYKRTAIVPVDSNSLEVQLDVFSKANPDEFLEMKNGKFKNGKLSLNKPEKMTYRYGYKKVNMQVDCIPALTNSFVVKQNQKLTLDDVMKHITNKAYVDKTLKEAFSKDGNPVIKAELDKSSVDTATLGKHNAIVKYTIKYEPKHYEDEPSETVLLKIPFEVTKDGEPNSGSGSSVNVPTNSDEVSAPVVNGTWHRDNKGHWTFETKDKKVLKNTRAKINGNIYSFDKDGVMKTGWVKENKAWSYYNTRNNGVEGAMAIKQWKKVGNDWYYFYGNGKMASKTWEKIDGNWYYFYVGGSMASDTMVGKYYVNKSGAWRTDKWVKTSAGKYWYYYKEGNYPKNEVVEINGNKYHFDNGGWMTTGWLKDNGTWYYFNEKGNGTEGAMAHDQWKKVNGNWYYFYKDGKMTSKTWEKIGGNWYYFYGSGKMAADTMVGKYYVNKSGAWRTDKWVKTSSGKYWYSFKEGGYPKNRFLAISGNSYYFDNGGWMKTGWLKNNGTWYYFNKKGEGTEGAMVKNSWKKVNGKWYYFYGNGKMAKNTTINGWRVNGSGAWVK